jgi:hypothetical protein
MAEISLKRLRDLRDRARAFSDHIVTDLSPFTKEDGTFRRLPDSRSVPGDINITTTCSCLMALALTDLFRDFYEKRTPKTSPEKTAEKLLRVLLSEPWMSSGLADNNAFTTTLVLRAYGFLTSEGLISVPVSTSESDDTEVKRQWELNLRISKLEALVAKLSEQSDPTSKFLWLSLSDLTRDLIAGGDAAKEEDLRRSLALDLRRIIESGWIYADGRFERASPETKASLASNPTGYKLVEVNRRLLSDQYGEEIPAPSVHTLLEIAQQVAQHPQNLSINRYPPSAAVLYWFVDGISRANLWLDDLAWQGLCSWATREFNQKRSLVVSEHDAMMDPIAMGMAACLCARLIKLSDGLSPDLSEKCRLLLPSLIELEHSIGELVEKQEKSGIWPKFFPLFHYQDAGSNFCFTFELLEGVLYEFCHSSSKILDDEGFVVSLERAVTWCEVNRLVCKQGGYSGWNSGGQLQTLEKGQPESWATAVVHMFLSELQTVLAGQIQQKILKKYRVTPPPNRKDASRESEVGALLDIEIVLPGQKHSLSKILSERVVENYRTQTEGSLRRKAIKAPLSALLFGPPGTSKTQVTRAVAADIGWPLIEISPSDFVKGRLENVYPQANEIFEDLMDLSGVVVLFDEMDALVQTRDGDFHLDITSQFLTTMMLPKLAELHDQGRVVFFMATNFQERFDPAIKRAGRFDLLLCMGPPSRVEKLKKLRSFFGEGASESETKLAAELIEQYLEQAPALQDALELLTYGEFKSFLKSIGNKNNIGAEIQALGEQTFGQRLKEYSSSATLRMEDLNSLGTDGLNIERLADAYKLAIALTELKEVKNIVRYLHDRKESRDQH